MPSQLTLTGSSVFGVKVIPSVILNVVELRNILSLLVGVIIVIFLLH